MKAHRISYPGSQATANRSCYASCNRTFCFFILYSPSFINYILLTILNIMLSSLNYFYLIFLAGDSLPPWCIINSVTLPCPFLVDTHGHARGTLKQFKLRLT